LQNHFQLLSCLPSCNFKGGGVSAFYLEPDIAVTALTEDGTGVVYIFHGHHEGIDPTPAQRIHPKTLKPEPSQPLRKFGQSVAGQFDVDGNGYPGDCFDYLQVKLLLR